MGRMLAALALVAIAGCDDDDDFEAEKIHIHVANQSGEPVWVGGEYDHEYSKKERFSGTVNPGEVGTFTVEYGPGDALKVRVFRVSDSFVLFEAVWSWGGDGDGSPENPPTDIPITIAP